MQLTHDYGTVLSALHKPIEKETREYSVEGRPDHLDELEKLFHWITFCCSAGHSAEAAISVDGDGAASIRIKGMKTEDPGEEAHEHNSSGPELKVGLA